MSERKQRWRVFRRRSTPILMVIAFAASAYVYVTWPDSYYLLQCERTDGPELLRRFHSSYACDSEAAQLLLSGESDCPRISCLRVDD